MWRLGKGVPDKGNSECKGPEAGLCLTCSKTSEKASVEETEQVGVRGRE